MAPMTFEFLGLALIALTMGVAFTAFPRLVRGAIEDAFGRLLGRTRVPSTGSARAVGVILLVVGALLIVFAFIGNYPRL